MKIILRVALFLLLGLSCLSSVYADIRFTNIPEYTYHDELNDILNEANKLLIANGLSKDSMATEDYNNAGMFFYNKKMWKEAELMFRMANEKPYSNRQAYYNLACVLSLCDDYAQNPAKIDFSDPIWDGEHHPYESALWYLCLSLLPEDTELPNGFITFDMSRVEKARNDADLNNLREAFPSFFDVLTLPDSEKEKFEYQGIYKAENGFEGHTWLEFTGIDNEEKMTNFMMGHNIKLKLPKKYESLLLYENNPWTGKKFKITYIKYLYYDDMGGIAISHKLIDIEEIISLRCDLISNPYL